MKIRTQFIAIVVAFSAMLAGIFVFTAISDDNSDRLNDQVNLLEAVRIDIGDLNYLSSDYILHAEPQQAQRWYAKFGSFSGRLDNLSVDGARQESLLRSLRNGRDDLKAVFDDVAGAIGGNNASGPNPGDASFIELSWSRLSVQLQGLAFDASRLSRMLHDDADRAQETGRLLVFSMMVVSVVFLMAFSAFTYWRIFRSVGRLKRGTEVIGSGDLDYRIVVKGRDEISELSSSFNEMAKKLRKTTASKQEIEAEVAQRRQAEEKLRRRTKELHSMNRELEEFNRTMVGRELRMAEMKKEITSLRERVGKVQHNGPDPEGAPTSGDYPRSGNGGGA